MKYNIIDIIDLDRLRLLLEKFTGMTGNATAIIDLEGKVLVATGWKDICVKFHRVHPETNRKCIESDTVLSVRLEKGERYNVYKCLNGMMDVAAPIIIEEKHMANLFIGQFLSEPPDMEFFRKQASEYGFDEEAYLKALSAVPVLSPEKMKLTMEFLSDLALLIGQMGLTLAKNKESNAEILKLREELERRKKRGGKYLGFVLAGQEYCINILKIKELIQLPPISPVSGFPGFVKGVINLRGRVIPIIDLRIILGISSATDYNDQTCIIITETDGKSENALIGMIADSVSDVSQIRGEDIEKVSEVGIHLNTDYIYGMAKTETSVKLLLNIENIFSDR
ncbi:PocR ligand-binding domain-containing protein [Desulfobacterales bacterium HSG2]|nr:PocR ligand-binding domain-containing protein [Desulfobacterales bacterium HSG2]